MKTIFDFDDHYSYLEYRFDKSNSKRGVKTKFSEFLQIQPAFLSQVLSRKYSISLEQAEMANRFFDHSTEECDFFILIVNKDRAGTALLKNYFQKQITETLRKRMLVVERLGRKFEISNEEKGVYYSSWIYSAVHMACTVPSMRTSRSIAKHLQISQPLCMKILDFLVSIHLLKKDGETYSVTNAWARLDNDSPHILKLHSNWRQKAIQNLDIRTDDDLHYSGVYSMSFKTAAYIKDNFLNFLKEQTKEVESSKEEDLFVIGVDFFKLIKSESN